MGRETALSTHVFYTSAVLSRQWMTPVKKRQSLLLLISLLGLLLACRLVPLTAEEILARTLVAMSRAETYRADLAMTARLPGLPATMTAEGVFAAPNQVYVITHSLGATVEFLSLGEAGRYIRLAGQEEWIALDSESSRTAAPLLPLGQWRILSTARNPQLVSDDERLDGLACYHLTMEVDLQALLELTAPMLADQVGASAPPRLEVWISQRDFLIRRLEYQMEFNLGGLGLGGTLGASMRLSHYNEPVEIPQP
jgi:hypothetical protein